MSAPSSEPDLLRPPRSPARQVSNPVSGLQTHELMLFKSTDPRRSTREQSIAVDDRPDLPHPLRSPGIQVSDPVAGLRTPELTLFKSTGPRRSTRDRSIVVDNQPRVCLRSPSARLHGTNYLLAAQPTRPMMPSNVGGDRNALKMPIMSDGLRSWSYELFDCFSDLPTCMYGLLVNYPSLPAVPSSLPTSGVLSCCCCCYVYSQNKQRFVHLETHDTPLREPIRRYNHDCLSWFLLQCCLNAGWGLQVRSSFPSPWMPDRRYGFSRRPYPALMYAGAMESAATHAMTSL
jgi:hypothetical protein